MPVAPLRKRHENGDLYCRPPEVEPVLAVLVRLGAQDLVERVRIADGGARIVVREGQEEPAAVLGVDGDDAQ